MIRVCHKANRFFKEVGLIIFGSQGSHLLKTISWEFTVHECTVLEGVNVTWSVLRGGMRLCMYSPLTMPSASSGHAGDFLHHTFSSAYWRRACAWRHPPRYKPSEDLRPVQQGGLQLLHSSCCLHTVWSRLLLPDEAQQAEGVPGALRSSQQRVDLFSDHSLLSQGLNFWSQATNWTLCKQINVLHLYVFRMKLILPLITSAEIIWLW